VQKSKPGFKKVKWHYQKIIEIPEEWYVEKLGKLCELREDGKITSDLYIGLEHIVSGNNTLEGKGNISDFSSTKNQFYEGDVLYGKLRPLLNKVWLATESGQCSTDILPIIASKKITNQLLLSILTNHHFFSYAVGTSAGTKMPRTNWTDIKKFITFLPSFPEQEKISSILSNVNELISSYDDMIISTIKLKKGLMQQLLTSGIGHKKFKKVKTRFQRIFTIPESWNVISIFETSEQKSNSIVDGPFGSDLKTSDYDPLGTIPVLTIGMLYNINEIKSARCITKKKIKEIERSKIVGNDIVMAKIGNTYGVNCIYPKSFPTAMIPANICKITVDSTRFDIQYLKFWFDSEFSKDFLDVIVKTSGQPAFGITEFKTLPVIAPSLPEQKKITSILSKMDTKINELKSKKSFLKNIKKGLMQQLLIGQIRV